MKFIILESVKLVVHSLLMEWLVVGLISHGGTIELFFVPASAPRLV